MSSMIDRTALTENFIKAFSFGGSSQVAYSVAQGDGLFQAASDLSLRVCTRQAAYRLAEHQRLECVPVRHRLQHYKAH